MFIFRKQEYCSLLSWLILTISTSNMILWLRVLIYMFSDHEILPTKTFGFSGTKDMIYLKYIKLKLPLTQILLSCAFSVEGGNFFKPRIFLHCVAIWTYLSNPHLCFINAIKLSHRENFISTVFTRSKNFEPHGI